MATLTRAMNLTRWADGLSTRTMVTLTVPYPGTQVEKLGRGYYNPNIEYFNIAPSTGQGIALLRDLLATKEPLDADSRQLARILVAEHAVTPTLSPGVALDAVLATVTNKTPVRRVSRVTSSGDQAPRSWQAAMPKDTGDSFAVCEGTSPKVLGIERRRKVWCKTGERGHNAIVRRRARLEKLYDASGAECWDGLPALMRKANS